MSGSLPQHDKDSNDKKRQKREPRSKEVESTHCYIQTSERFLVKLTIPKLAKYIANHPELAMTNEVAESSESNDTIIVDSTRFTPSSNSSRRLTTSPSKQKPKPSEPKITTTERAEFSKQTEHSRPPDSRTDNEIIADQTSPVMAPKFFNEHAHGQNVSTQTRSENSSTGSLTGLDVATAMATIQCELDAATVAKSRIYQLEDALIQVDNRREELALQVQNMDEKLLELSNKVGCLEKKCNEMEMHMNKNASECASKAAQIQEYETWIKQAKQLFGEAPLS